MAHSVYLALGSNLGDRLANLATARASMAPHIEVIAVTPVYETPPWGYLDQPSFLNQALHGQTALGPYELLARLKGLEDKMGRQNTFRNSPRPIDLDIIFYDDLVMENEALTIPHPRLRGRAFVLAPLADLAPDLVHPKLDLTVRQLLEETDTTGILLYQPGDSQVELP